MTDAIIVGGGASGLICGIEAARRGRTCLILEQKEKAGKKLYATGNGRCNLANRRYAADCYHAAAAEDEAQIAQVVTERTWQDVADFFGALGVPCTERQAYLYPRSGQAAAVVHALEQAYLQAGGRLLCGERVCQVRLDPEQGGVQVWTQTTRYRAHSLVLATGGQAAPALGSDGSGYRLARQLGHTVTVCAPALCGLRCKEPGWNRLQGVRAKGEAALWVDGGCRLRDSGEIQFTAYGVSGIVIFNLSRYASLALAEGGRAELCLTLDLLCDMPEEELSAQWRRLQKTCGFRLAADVLSGFLPDKLAEYLLMRSSVPGAQEWGALTDEELSRLLTVCKRLSLTVTGTNDDTQAQATAGGVLLSEVDLETMESRRQPKCYLTGELLDADGRCGGYNLMWAWETGRRAGRHL